MRNCTEMSNSKVPKFRRTTKEIGIKGEQEEDCETEQYENEQTGRQDVSPSEVDEDLVGKEKEICFY